MIEYTPTPIEPKPWFRSSQGVDHFLEEIRMLSGWQRFALALAMGGVAGSLLWGAYAITRLQHWVAVAFAVLLLEPLGAFAALAAVYSLSPTSAAGRWLGVALRRAMVVLVVLFSGLVVGTLVVVGWLGWELLKNR
jgi:hypothetical protein